MTDCVKIQEMISAMLDGELSEKERRAIEEHIAVCSECAAMYADFAALSGEIAEAYAEVPAALHDKIMKGVRTAPAKKRPLLITLRPYMSAAACLAVVVGAVFAIRDSRNDIKWLSSTSDSTAAYEMPASAPAAAADVYSLEAETEEAGTTESAAVSRDDNKNTVFEDAAAAEPAAPMEAPADTEVDEPAEDIPAEDAKNDMAEEECADDLSRDMPLYGYAPYEPGTAIDEAWYIHYSSGEDFPQMQRILFPELLQELLAPSEKQTDLDSPPTDADAIVRLRCGGEYTAIKLYFTDGLILVETSESLYTAVGSPEEFLSINDYTIG